MAVGSANSFEVETCLFGVSMMAYPRNALPLAVGCKRRRNTQGRVTAADRRVEWVRARVTHKVKLTSKGSSHNSNSNSNTP